MKAQCQHGWEEFLKKKIQRVSHINIIRTIGPAYHKNLSGGATFFLQRPKKKNLPLCNLRPKRHLLSVKGQVFTLENAVLNL